MNITDPVHGKIITFYSYKGGTGRSMAVANLACWLAKQVLGSPRGVLVMDWDLEAPGLHRFFAAEAEQPDNLSRPGVINYFDLLHRKLRDGSTLYAEITSKSGTEALDRAVPLDDYLIRDVSKGVDFIKAGRLTDDDYANLINSFSWVEFFTKYGAAIETFRDLLSSRYLYCLIDSRTGFTDISGICTMLMPEKMVTVFTPNRQSLSGILDLSARAVNYRRSSNDFRPLSIFPLPSRIENSEKVLKEKWREQYQRE